MPAGGSRSGSVLAILGPTASGKSLIAQRVALARRDAGFDTQIVAVDAFTVYRGMDLATAKPSAEDRRAVPHHLVDVFDPSAELSVAGFQALARKVIDDLLARRVTPLLVGGSGLYWRAVVDELQFPPTDPVVRERLRQRFEHDPAGAHAVLAARDPSAADNIALPNVRRTIRALEVIELTGRRFSSFSTAWERHESRYAGLEVAYIEPPLDRLRERIRERAHAMVAAGLLEEARALRQQGPLSRTACQAIGYAEAFAVLDGNAEADDLAERIARRTAKYARRQRSWFRADPRCRACEAEDVLQRWAPA